MPNYRRWFVPGGTYFFTVVTFERRKFLHEDAARPLLRKAIEDTRQCWPFEIVAWVLLPHHLHAVWTLPAGDDNYSLRWAKIKEHFTRSYLAQGGGEGVRNRSRRRHRERAIWQRRFWEHTVEDEEDLAGCVDYAHWNPVKHGWTDRVGDWPWSTFHRFLALGYYGLDWGRTDPCPGNDAPEWGE